MALRVIIPVFQKAARAQTGKEHCPGPHRNEAVKREPKLCSALYYTILSVYRYVLETVAAWPQTEFGDSVTSTVTT